jgi:hypothetical protein
LKKIPFRDLDIQPSNFAFKEARFLPEFSSKTITGRPFVNFLFVDPKYKIDFKKPIDIN